MYLTEFSGAKIQTSHHHCSQFTSTFTSLGWGRAVTEMKQFTLHFKPHSEALISKTVDTQQTLWFCSPPPFPSASHIFLFSSNLE